MRASVLLLALFLFHPQDPADPSLDQIIDRMEKAASAARGSTFIAAPQNGLPAEFTVAKDGTVRIQEPPPAELKAPGAKTRFRIMVLGDGACYDIEDDLASSWGEAARTSVRRKAEKFVPAACDRIDPFWQNSAGGAAWPWSWHRWLYALAPRRAFSYERDLKLAGRRRFQGEECFVLTSGRPLDYSFTRTGPAGNVESGGYSSQRRKFYVRTSDYTLKRVVDINQWAGGDYPGYGDYPFDRCEGGIPTGVFADSGEKGIFTRDIRRGLDLAGESLLPDVGDLYATQARSGTVGERLAKSPDDPDLLFSEAILDAHRRFGGQQSARPFDEKFAKIVAQAWKSTPVRNLISLLIDTGDLEALKAVLARVEADPAMSKAAVLERIRGWMKADEHDKAAAVLASAPDPEAVGLPLARAEMAIRRGDYAGAIASYLKWPLPPGEFGRHTLSGQLLMLCWKMKDPHFSNPSMIDALEKAVSAQPKNELLLLARLQFLYYIDDPARIAAVIRHTLENSTDPYSRRMAVSKVKDVFSGDWLARIDPDKLAEARDRILGALSLADGELATAAVRAHVLKKEGKKEEALREYRKEVELVEKLTGPSETAGWAAKAAEELGDDELRERACLGQLAIYRRDRRDPGHSAWWGNNPEPLEFLRPRLGAARRYLDLYQAIRGIPSPYGFSILRDGTMRTNMKDLGEVVMDAGRQEKDPAYIRWFAHMMVRTHAQTLALCNFDSLEFLLKAREAEPKNLETLQMLAEKQAAVGLDREAIETARAIQELLLSGARGGSWSAAEATLFAAERHLSAGRKTEARKSLDSLEWEREDAPSWNLWRAAEIYESLGAFDKAVMLMTRSEEDGHRPYARLAQIAVKKEDWYEATRQINRALQFGCSSWVLKPGQGATNEQFNARFTPEVVGRMRDEIRAKAGDTLINRLLASKMPALSADESARAARAFERLGSGTISEREAALKEFRDLGPRSAAILHKALAEPDSIWRTAAKEQILSWAEPR